MINLVTGLHDTTPEAKSARKDEIEKIGTMVKVCIEIDLFSSNILILF
jgi:hypothetical protein